MAGESATQRATKAVAGGFPVAVACHRAIELVLWPIEAWGAKFEELFRCKSVLI